MVLLTYQLPDAIREIAMQGEFNEFDLNVFFSAEGVGNQAHFKYEDEVQKWLDMIRGAFMPTSVDNLNSARRSRRCRSQMCGSWAYFLTRSGSCRAWRRVCYEQPVKEAAEPLLPRLRCHRGRRECRRHWAGVAPVLEAMDDPLKTKTITLSAAS